MKKIYLAITILVLSFTNLYSQKIGAIFIGANNYLNTGSGNHYHVNLTGVSAGWLIPINIERLQVYYKVKASHHTIEDYETYGFRAKLDYFFSASNEILVGKKFKKGEKICIIPQLGFGAIGEAAYYDWDQGLTHGGAFIDISFIITYDYRNLSFGLMANFEQDIISEAESMVSGQRVNISLLLLK